MYSKTYIILMLIIIILNVLTACKKQSQQPLQEPTQDTINIIPSISKSLKVHVYLDSTLSMKGYVSQSETTRYMQTIQNLESGIKNGWKDLDISFYKFGSSILQLSGREHIRAVEPSFYHSGGLSTQTQISKVFKLESIVTPGNLSIIITDLFENNSDLTNLSNLIKENVFNKNLSMGVIGTRSQFVGNIYDVGIRGATFPYASEDGKIETYRPFYIIAIGNHADVINFFERLRERLPFLDKQNFSLFSRYIVNPLATFEGSIRSKAANLNPVENLVKPISPRIKQLRILDDSDAKATYSVPLNPISYSPTIDSKPLEIEVKGEQYENGKKTTGVDGLIVEQTNISANKLLMPLRVKPGAIKEGHVYRFKITAFPARDSYVLPDWWRQWNLDPGSIVSRKANKNVSIDGGKTQNLNLFMTSLWNANYIMQHPKVFESYLYIVNK